MSRTVRMSVHFATAALGLWLASMDAVSAQDSVRKYQIAEQSLGQALREFALASNLDLLFSPDLVAGKKSSSLDGKFTVDEGLRTLLRGSGLEFSVSGSRIVINEAKSTPARQANAPTTSATNGTNGYTRLAQADAAEPSSSSATSPSSANDEGLGVSGTGLRLEDRIALEEIVVTGTNIRGVYPASSPVTIYTAEDIARSGATTTEQFFQRLPENHGTRTQNAPDSSQNANYEGISTVDLRGLGVGTTLVLINGRRVAPAGGNQAVDISMIPVSTIERVEILTDGASAIYGSDAIGGVVNLVLRKDLDGAQTALSYGGVTQGDLRQGAVTQSAGVNWNTGRALLAYNYFSASDLQQSDRPYASAAGRGTLLPDTERHGVLATISQDLGAGATVSGDFLFARRDSDSNRTVLNAFHSTQSASDQYFGTLALDWTLAADWHAAIFATYSENDTNLDVRNVPLAGGAVSAFDLDSFSSGYDFNAMFDGKLFTLPGGAVRFSIGAGYISEKFAKPGRRDLERETRSYFGELLIPLLSESQGAPFVRRLELSLAARRTEYEDRTDPGLGIDFGEKTSPKVGLLWSPAEGLNLRATHGESFRAAPLAQIDPAGAFNSISPPGFFGTPDIWSPTGATILLGAVGGANATLAPETADTSTVGFDWDVAAVSGLTLSATYFKIDYTDRVGLPDPTSIALFNPQAFPEIFVVAPTADFVAPILENSLNFLNTTSIDLSDPAAAAAQLAALPSLVVYDGRLRNLSLSELDGFDLGAGYAFSVSDTKVSVGVDASYLSSYKEQITRSSAVMSVVDTVLRPVDLRGNVYVGLARGGAATRLTANYVDGYRNPFVTGGGEVGSWLTFDWNATYQFTQAAGVLEGVRVSMSVQNLFDRDPPFVALSTVASQGINRAIGFDPANASPLGRFAVIEVSKQW